MLLHAPHEEEGKEGKNLLLLLSCPYHWLTRTTLSVLTLIRTTY